MTVNRLLDLPGGKRPHEGLLIWEKRSNSFYMVNLIDMEPYGVLLLPAIISLFRTSYAAASTICPQGKTQTNPLH